MSGRSIPWAGITALALAVAGVVAPPAVADEPTYISMLPPPVKPCPSRPGMSEPRGNCLWDYAGDQFTFTLSPHVVRVGDVITGRVVDRRPANSTTWGWIVPGTWHSLPGCFGGPTTRVGTIPTNLSGSGVCRWRVTERIPQGIFLDWDDHERLWHGYLTAGASTGAMGEFPDNDYYLVLGEDEHMIQGQVQSPLGGGVPGVPIRISGPGPDLSVRTGSDGRYGAVVAGGTYTVTPAGRGRFSPARRRVTVHGATTNASFRSGGEITIAGTLRDHRGRGLAGVRVSAASTAGPVRRGAVTDASGRYRIETPAGPYDVRVVLSGRTERERWDPATRHVEGSAGTVRADFALTKADEVDLRTDVSRLVAGVWWTTGAANGRVSTEGVVEVRNGRDDPVPDVEVRVDAPYWDVPVAGQPEPRLVVCDDVWRRVYPGRFERITGPDGAAHFRLFLGGQAANAWWHAREASDPTTVFDVERIGMLGAPVPPDEIGILTTLKGATIGGPFSVAPLFGPTAAGLQESLLDWLLRYQGQGEQVLSIGAFAPVRTAGGSRGGIVFFPAGDPAPLLAYLSQGTPLPAGYVTRVVPILHLAATGSAVVQLSGFSGLPPDQGLPDIAYFEARFGRAQAGYMRARANEGLVYLGGPYPPAIGDPLRAGFARCAPGAAPSTITVEASRQVEVTASGRQGGSVEAAPAGRTGAFRIVRRGQPAVLVLPPGTRTLRLTGRAGGLGVVEVTSGGRTATFALASRRGAEGTLRVGAGGPPRTLRFAGRVVRAEPQPVLVRGLRRTLRAGRPAVLRVRVSDAFGRALTGVLVSTSAPGARARAVTGAGGRAVLRLRAPRPGGVRVRVAAPGHGTSHVTVRVRR